LNRGPSRCKSVRGHYSTACHRVSARAKSEPYAKCVALADTPC